MLHKPDPPRNDNAKRASSRPQGGSFVLRSAMALTRASLAGIGVVLVPTGVVVTMMTPILPIGLPIVILGVVLVARNASWGRRMFQAILAKYPRLERFAPDWLLRLIFGEVHDKPEIEEQKQT